MSCLKKCYLGVPFHGSVIIWDGTIRGVPVRICSARLKEKLATNHIQSNLVISNLEMNTLNHTFFKVKVFLSGETSSTYTHYIDDVTKQFILTWIFWDSWVVIWSTFFNTMTINSSKVDKALRMMEIVGLSTRKKKKKKKPLKTQPNVP